MNLPIYSLNGQLAFLPTY